MNSFVLASGPPSPPDEDTIVLEVELCLDNKKALFSWFSEHLRFPSYFGCNWDAFDECIHDLSWLKERKIILFHRDLPFNDKAADRKIYLDVLATAVRDWQSEPSHELVVVFDPSLELKLRQALGK